MTQINGLVGTVSAIGGSTGAWTATVNINSSGFSTYTSGGTAVGLPYNLGTISNIVAGATTVVTFSNTNQVHPFQSGENVSFSGVLGMTQINSLSGLITATSGTGPGTWSITVSINSSGFSAYTSGGQAVASDGYTSLAQYYQSAYANNGTYGCVVENVNINSFVVGVAIGLSGNANLAADLTFRNVNVFNCDVCYAIGQGQSRNLNIEYGNVANARTGIDGINYGLQSGTPPQFLRVNFGFLYRIIALNQSIGNCVFEDCYTESIICVGQYGYGGAATATPLTFLGGDFYFGAPGWLMAPILLESYGPTTFRGTALNYVSEIDAFNFAMPTAPMFFDHCYFTGTAVSNIAPHVALTVDAGNGGYAKLLDCWVNGAAFGGNAFLVSEDMGRSYGVAKFTTSAGRLAAMYQTYRVSNGNAEYVYLPYSSQPSIAVGNVSSLTKTGTNVTFTCTSAAQLMQGDILFWLMTRQGNSLLQWNVPALKISSIVGNAVTCSFLFDPAQYDTVAHQPSSTQVAVAPNHWAPTQGLTGSITNTSTTITSVSPTTILQNGDFVVGANIPANTRVLSGGGTATVTISQAATATASGVELYFGRLYTPTLTPLT
jgi:hypothetical protein